MRGFLVYLVLQGCVAVKLMQVRCEYRRSERAEVAGGFPVTVEIEPVRSGINRAWSMRW